VDDILLIGNDVEMLNSVKEYLNSKFSMKDMGEAAYVLSIKIYRDRSRLLLSLSQSTYLFSMNNKFSMKDMGEEVQNGRFQERILAYHEWCAIECDSMSNN
jgi:hypothetical protein